MATVGLREGTEGIIIDNVRIKRKKKVLLKYKLAYYEINC